MNFRVLAIAANILVFTAQALSQEPMSCTVRIDEQSTAVVVVIQTPHAKKLLITTPDQRRIYLRDSDTPTRFPDVDDFVNLGTFTIDGKTQGTWFNDWGETEVVRALGQSGEYKLLVADDLESARGQAAGVTCTFMIEANLN